MYHCPRATISQQSSSIIPKISFQNDHFRVVSWNYHSNRQVCYCWQLVVTCADRLQYTPPSTFYQVYSSKYMFFIYMCFPCIISKQQSQSNYFKATVFHPRATIPEQLSQSNWPSNHQSDQLRAIVLYYPRESFQNNHPKATVLELPSYQRKSYWVWIRQHLFWRIRQINKILFYHLILVLGCRHS